MQGFFQVSRHRAGTVLILLIIAVAAGAAMAGWDNATITGDASKGKANYDKLCASCHGLKGDGKGPAAAGANWKMRDFTNKDVMAKIPDARILKVIRDGRDTVPLLGMKAWKDQLTLDEINDVAAYVKSFSK